MLILALALVFLGPEKLPDVARQVGKFVGQIRRTTDELKRTLDTEIRDEERDRRLAEYRKKQADHRAEREATLAGTGEGPGELTSAEESAQVSAALAELESSRPPKSTPAKSDPEPTAVDAVDAAAPAPPVIGEDVGAAPPEEAS